MKNRKNDKLYRFCLFVFRLFTRPFRVYYSDDSTVPAVYVVHHQNLHGPLICMGWFNKPVHLWVLSVFYDRKTCFRQYYDYTFTQRFGWPKFLAAIVAYPVSLFVSALMKSMDTIPVYRGSKDIVKTFKQSIEDLFKGENILISPDIAYTDTSAAIGEMYDGFLDLEKYYMKKTGRHLPFIPLQADQQKNIIYEGKPVYFNSNDDFRQEKSQVYDRLKQEFSRLEKL